MKLSSGLYWDTNSTDSDNEDTASLDSFLKRQYAEDTKSRGLEKYYGDTTESSIKSIYQRWQLLVFAASIALLN
jgi:hypothetical protein